MKNLDLGRAEISPRTPVEAGSLVTITYTYAAGHPVDDSGYLLLAFRFAGDFGQPQFTDPAAPNFCSLKTTGHCRLEPRWDPKGYTRPWGLALFVKITGGYLDRGDKIIIVFGDRSGGSPGWRAQTFCEKTFEFKTLVDPFATYRFKELPKSPCLRIVAGPPARAVVIAPSQARSGRKVRAAIKLEDTWGNPAGRPRTFLSPSLDEPGVQTLCVRDPGTGLEARGNPIEVSDKPPAWMRLWADFHGQSEETIGTNSVEDYFRFARDRARLDIAAHQGNDFQVTDELWARINAAAKRFYKPGRFVTFPGYEWSGNTPLGGDRNVYYGAEGGRITRSCRDLLPPGQAPGPDSPTARDLFRNLKGPSPFVFAHVGGRYADMRMHDERFEKAVEIHSAWGTFEWLLEDALRQGWRVGVCANSDDHKGRPGASWPGAGKFGSYGGLTCVLAQKLDRPSVLEAIQARRFYATTGHRPLLDVLVTTGDGGAEFMGGEIQGRPGPTPFRFRYAGTAPVESVTIRNGIETVAVLRPWSPADLGARVKVAWAGAEVRGRARMTRWDGGLSVQGARIRSFEPVNFFSPSRPMRQTKPNALEWQSVTTGGYAGVILALDRMEGALEITTAQGSARLDLASLDMEPSVWAYGGLGKEMRVTRLPAKPAPPILVSEFRIPRLKPGCNALYARIDQEDGHSAWSSPVYVTL